MSGTIRKFLNHIFPPTAHVFLREQERLQKEIYLLREQLSEHSNMVNEECRRTAEMQELLFDEMTQHVRAAQTEIIEGMEQQFQAAEMMRQEHTDQIAALTRELAEARAELAVQRQKLTELCERYSCD